MSETSFALTAADKDGDTGIAVTPWVKTGPFAEGNAVRQFFGAGALDGGTATVEVSMAGPYDDPNEGPVEAPDNVTIALADPEPLTDLAERADGLIVTRAHWARISIAGAGAALDTRWWLK